MKKFLLLIFASLVSCGMLWAQQTVTGRVTDSEDGSPLPGVNILEKGTSNGTVTDVDGNYTMSVNGDGPLVFSYVGYVSQEVAIGGRSQVNVALESDVTQLSEVVVVGYGTQEKKEITSAVASVGVEEFNNGNITSPEQLLQGKVAGLSITSAGGDPNAGSRVRLRGLSTFGANSSPLVVIDGVIGASLDNIDPNDIQTIDVLKDGSAAAIYGARGSSGVILVTTKSGKGAAGAPTTQIDFNGFITVDNVANTIDVLSSDAFVEQGGEDFGSETDWIDELIQTAVSYTSNLSIGGSNGMGTSYRASVNYRNNEGVAIGTGFERINTRLQLNQEAMDGRLRFGVNFSFNDRSQESINNAAFRYAVIYNPTAPIFDDIEAPADGGYFQRNLFDFYNPVALSKQQTFAGQRQNALFNGNVQYDILDNLTLALNYGRDMAQGWDGSYWSKYDLQFGAGGNGIARKTQYDNLSEIFTGTLNFNMELVDNLDFTLLLGAETQRRREEGFGVQVRNFLFDDTGWDNLGFASIRQGVNTDLYSYHNENVLNSGFARANFNYDNTYFLSASIRGESFSGFGEDEKTGYFPAVSAGVEIANIVDLGVVSSLKFRVSYGVTGNLPPDPYLALALYDPGARLDLDGDPLTSDDIFVSPVLRQNPNPQLKWETKEEWDIGLDFGLFDDKVTGTMDYYQRNISDLIFRLTVSPGNPNAFQPGGFNISNSTWANVGELTAGGFEFALTVHDIALGQVSWTPSVNFTVYDKTTIENFDVPGTDLGFSELRFATPGSPGQNNNPIIRNKVGETLGDMYGPEFQGIDESGNYVLSSTDPEEWGIIGNGLPDGEFGFSNTFNYKNWDFNFFLRGAFGHDLYNSYRGFYEPRDAASTTWNSVDTELADPRITATPTFSSLYIEDASFIRLDNAQIGYLLPLESSVLTRFRVYIAAQNLFTITDYTGIDPTPRLFDSEDGNGFTQNLAPGLERRNTYFTTRSFTFGIQVGLK
jgi:TonB-dependent starch-binding outer membrane protein SusC